MEYRSLAEIDRGIEAFGYVANAGEARLSMSATLPAPVGAIAFQSVSRVSSTAANGDSLRHPVPRRDRDTAPVAAGPRHFGAETDGGAVLHS